MKNDFIKEFTELLVKHDVQTHVKIEPVAEGINSCTEFGMITPDFNITLDELIRRVFNHANKAVEKKYRPKGLAVRTSAKATVIHHNGRH